MTALLTKIEFLDNVSEFFPHYSDETFEANLLRNNGFLLKDDEQSAKVQAGSGVNFIKAFFEGQDNLCALRLNFTPQKAS